MKLKTLYRSLSLPHQTKHSPSGPDSCAHLRKPSGLHVVLTVKHVQELL